MTVTNESGGRLNAFANEPQIDVIAAKTTLFKPVKVLGMIFAIALISIIGIYLILN